MGQTCSCRDNTVIQQKNTLSKQNIYSTSFSYNEQNDRTFHLNGKVYVEQKYLGSGSFSEVYLVKNSKDNTLHALKILKDINNKEAFMKEFQIMKNIDSQFVIKFEEVLEINQCFCFLMEYANQGTLSQFMQNNRNKINSNILLDMICDIFLGLEFLHKKQIIHRDLKMDNILVSDHQVKIADLGVAVQLATKNYAETQVGNMLYAAPEKMQTEGNYDVSSDIYSAGLIICQLIFNISSIDILKIKVQNNFSFINQSPIELKSFLLSLISADPKERLDATQAYQLARQFKMNNEIINFLQNEQFPFSKYICHTNQFFTNSITSSIEQLFNEGLQLHLNFKDVEAEYVFDKILEQNPNSIQGSVGKLLCQYRLLFSIIKKNINKDQLKLKQKQLLLQDSNFYIVHYAGALLYDGEEGIECIDYCIQLNPDFIQAYARKGILLFSVGKVDQALQILHQALQKDNELSSIYRSLGDIYFGSNKELALQNYNKSVEVNSNNYFSLGSIAQCYLDRIQLDLAGLYINKALSINQYYKSSISTYFKILIAQNKFELAIQEMENIFKTHGEQEDLFFSLALCYLFLKNNNKSLLYFIKDTIINKNPLSYHNIGFLYAEEQNYVKAQEYYIKSIEMKTKITYINMYHLLIQLFQTYEAEQYIEELLDLEYDENNEKDIIYKLIAYGILKQYYSYLELAKQLVEKFPQSQEINEQILSALSDIEFDVDYEAQLNIVQKIELNTATTLSNIKVQFKCYIYLGLEEIALQHMIQSFEKIFQEVSAKFDLENLFQYVFNGLQKQLIFTQFIKYFHENYPYSFHCAETYIMALLFGEKFTQQDGQIQIEGILNSQAIQSHYNKLEISNIFFIYYRRMSLFLIEVEQLGGQSCPHLIYFYELALLYGQKFFEEEPIPSKSFFVDYLSLFNYLYIFEDKQELSQKKMQIFSYITLKQQIKNKALSIYQNDYDIEQL